MITKQQYVQYLISTPVNYTCMNLADHLEGTSHDAVNDYLRREKHAAHHLWELAEPLIHNRSDSYLIVDDSVQDKRHSRVMELVKRQYSGNVHGLVKGIGIVNLVHSDRTDYYPIDFHGCGFSPRFSRASGGRGTNHRLQASRPSGGGSIRRKAFQAGVYPPPAQPTGFSR